jgi:hypothetical protein
MIQDVAESNFLLKILQAERKEKVNGGVYHFTQVKLSYNSNRIEVSN